MVKGPTQSNALLILFPGYNTLDVNGPYETLRQVKYGTDKKEMFKVTTAAENQITISAEGMKIERDIALDQNLLESVGDYDLLIVPGGTPAKVMDQINKTDAIFNRIIKKYSDLHPRSDSNSRILFSICTGALFLGKQDVFNGGRYCTTHWGSYDQLVSINNAAAEAASSSTPTATATATDTEDQSSTKVKPGVVVPARFVDSGLNKQQIRIISSGGISCGIDASLHIVRLRGESLAGKGKGEELAAATAKILDYPFRFTEGVVFDESF